jgi:hypothetical protein
VVVTCFEFFRSIFDRDGTGPHGPLDGFNDTEKTFLVSIHTTLRLTLLRQIGFDVFVSTVEAPQDPSRIFFFVSLGKDSGIHIFGLLMCQG